MRVLLVEDSELDAQLLRAELERGFEVDARRVQTEAELRSALGRERWDALLCAVSLPSFDAASALRVQKERAPELGRSFDHMAARLEEGRDALQARVEAERQALRTAARLAGDLQQGLEQLEAANRELEALSYSVLHDLRAPLRHLTGFVQLLRRNLGERVDEKGRHYLAGIGGAAENMGALIDGLLACSRLGRAELVMGRVALPGLVAEVIRDLEEEAGPARVAWQIAPLPEVDGDAAMRRLVYQNLLGNALKFSRTRPEARIAVGATVEPGEVRCFVRDKGVGFDMRHADKLFGLFQRLHRAEEFEGTGVGLANVQRIVRRHGGRVGAAARLDQGATFWFTLPRR